MLVYVTRNCYIPPTLWCVVEYERNPDGTSCSLGCEMELVERDVQPDSPAEQFINAAGRPCWRAYVHVVSGQIQGMGSIETRVVLPHYVYGAVCGRYETVVTEFIEQAIEDYLPQPDERCHLAGPAVGESREEYEIRASNARSK